MTTDAVLSHQGLVRELERLHVEKRTGTARVATTDNQLLQVGFDNGEIVAVQMGLKQNLDAIKLFGSIIRTGRLKFSEGKVRVNATGELPATAASLRMLGLSEASKPSARAIGPAVTIAAAVGIIERETIEFLGPMASIIWKEQIAKVGDISSPGAVPKLIDSLAREIGASGDANKARQFKDALEKKLTPR